MGSIADIEQNIKNQFISLFDSVLFIAEHGKGTNEQAFKLLKAKLLDKQIHLFLVDDFSLVEIALFQDDYMVGEYEGKYITVNFICSELEKSIAKNTPTNEIKNYGFGLKRFYETVQNNLKITIPENLCLTALSPDCYHDNENPLTPVVKELQVENNSLKSKITSSEYLYEIQKSFFEDTNNKLKTLKNELEPIKSENYYLKLELNSLEEKNKSYKRKNELLSQFQGLKGVTDLELLEKTSNQDTQIAILSANNERLQSENELLGNQLEKANERIKELEALASQPTAEPIGGNPAYDWQAMDKNIYPPELHLAMMIWEKYYDPNLADMSQFSTPKFNKISTSIGLTNKDLKARIRTILTPMLPKKKSNVLFTNLKSIEGLHLQDFNPPE